MGRTSLGGAAACIQGFRSPRLPDEHVQVQNPPSPGPSTPFASAEVSSTVFLSASAVRGARPPTRGTPPRAVRAGTAGAAAAGLLGGGCRRRAREGVKRARREAEVGTERGGTMLAAQGTAAGGHDEGAGPAGGGQAHQPARGNAHLSGVAGAGPSPG
ncbi:unnamed protein product [Prorocentrum cordatum]|uniref:Uncharacterized protein n=1 Tax=Prorocentrum cordatum TaxID=2364126 RepID=A0ABN9U1E2_9DINO|nr:unnamed protein product [Polarella glacialis]